MDARELSASLAKLIADYRENHGGLKPTSIHASSDVLAVLRAAKDPLLRKAAGGYTFDGVPIQPSKDQVLPFKLRP